MIRYVGYACINESLKPLRMRTCRLKTIEEKGIGYLKELILHNLHVLQIILEWNEGHQIKFFRVSSDIMPLITHPHVIGYGWDWQKDEEVLALISAIRSFVQDHGHRLSMHPDQYTVLNSLKMEVVERSIVDLKYQSSLLKMLGGQDMIIHVGGVYGDKPAAMERFVGVYKTLPPGIKAFLRLENDDKSYTIHDVIKIYKTTGCPLVFDYHHHRCHQAGPLTQEDIQLIVNSWQKAIPKVHLSSGRDHDEDRRHNDWIKLHDYKGLDRLFQGYEIDIMLECKQKEKALLKLQEELYDSL